MFLNRCSRPPAFRVFQKGYLIPLALFIVVGLGILAIAISKLAASAHNLALREDIATQAFFAAESGSQLAIYSLFLSAASRTQTTSNCTNLNGSTRNLTATGVNNCTLSFTCSKTDNTQDTQSFYRITSSASCGSGALSAVRSITVSAKMQ